MKKLKRSDFRPAAKRIASLPKLRRKKIEALANAISSELHLVEIRKALSLTQMDVAIKTGMAQAEISRHEHADLTSTMIGTLDRYVSGVGGKLRLVAEMPDGTIAEIPMRKGKPVRSGVRVE